MVNCTAGGQRPSRKAFFTEQANGRLESWQKPPCWAMLVHCPSPTQCYAGRIQSQSLIAVAQTGVSTTATLFVGRGCLWGKKKVKREMRERPKKEESNKLVFTFSTTNLGNVLGNFCWDQLSHSSPQQFCTWTQSDQRYEFVFNAQTTSAASSPVSTLISTGSPGSLPDLAPETESGVLCILSFQATPPPQRCRVSYQCHAMNT